MFAVVLGGWICGHGGRVGCKGMGVAQRRGCGCGYGWGIRLTTRLERREK